MLQPKSCSWYVTRVGEEWAQIWGRRRGVPHQCRPCGGRRLRSRRRLSTSVLPASLSVGVSGCNQAAEMSLSSWGHSGVSEPCFVSHSSLLLGRVLHLGAGGLLRTEDAGWVLTWTRGSRFVPSRCAHGPGWGPPPACAASHPSPVAGAAVWRDRVRAVLLVQLRAPLSSCLWCRCCPPAPLSGPGHGREKRRRGRLRGAPLAAGEDSPRQELSPHSALSLEE